MIEISVPYDRPPYMLIEIFFKYLPKEYYMHYIQ